MKIKKSALLAQLSTATTQFITQAESYLDLNHEQLNWKESPKKWSVLECLEHMNIYGDFYLNEIESRMNKGVQSETDDTFKSGWLGNYFAESMLPKEGMKTMNTFKSMNPAGSTLDKSVLKKFIQQQKKMLALLQSARQVDLIKTRTGTTLGNWLTIRLGDTFRFFVNHNIRHMLQAENVLKKQKEAAMQSNMV